MTGDHRRDDQGASLLLQLIMLDGGLCVHFNFYCFRVDRCLDRIPRGTRSACKTGFNPRFRMEAGIGAAFGGLSSTVVIYMCCTVER